jgi:hypothetical protein
MSLVYVVLKQAPLSRLPFRQQRWYWLAKSGDNQRKLARSSERYFNRVDAINAINVLFADASNVYRREAELGDVMLRLANPL